MGYPLVMGVATLTGHAYFAVAHGCSGLLIGFAMEHMVSRQMARMHIRRKQGSRILRVTQVAAFSAGLGFSAAAEQMLTPLFGPAPTVTQGFGEWQKIAQRAYKSLMPSP